MNADFASLVQKCWCTITPIYNSSWSCSFIV